MAHRIATIQNADQIIVLDKGQIAQSETHDELIKAERIYKNFVEIIKQAEGRRM